MSRRVLVADHDARVRDGCLKFLTSRGLDVSVVTDGLQCIEHLKESLPNLLILDPEILWGGGLGVLTWLKEEAPQYDIAVVLMESTPSPSLPQELDELVNLRIKRCHRLTDFGDLARQVHELLDLDVTRTQEAETDGEIVTTSHTSARIVP